MNLHAQTTCIVLLSEIQKNRKLVDDDDYVIGRGLDQYFTLLPDLPDIITSLKQTDHWIDVGAALARAQTHYLLSEYVDLYNNLPGSVLLELSRRKFEVPKIKSKVTAITAGSRLMDNDLILELKRNFGFEYLWGRTLEQIPTEELSSATIITDVKGALTYSEHLDQTLNELLGILQPNGVLLSSITNVRILNEYGEVTPLQDWFTSIDGAKTTWKISSSGELAFKLTKEKDLVTVPSLELIGFRADVPPERTYRLTR